jgi:hypothetical protein
MIDEDDEDAGRVGIFAIMWDCHGLEAVARVPDPADTTFALLKGTEPPKGPNINHWSLRARYNSQRHYEIYIITAAPGICENDIREMFENDPQSAADTIRRIGQKFHSDRAQEDRVVIR